MKIFCTGASGYIGGSVAAHLAASGHQVTGLVRSGDKADAVRAFGIEPVMGTLDDSDVLARAASSASEPKPAYPRPSSAMGVSLVPGVEVPIRAES